MEQAAVAYKVGEKLIIGSLVRTSMGVGIEVAPAAFEVAIGTEAIKAALGQALENSRQVVPHPSQNEWKGLFKPFEEAAGVRSYRAFVADAQSVHISATDERLELTPQRNLGTKDGFEPMRDRAIVLPPSDLFGAATALMSLFRANGS